MNNYPIKQAIKDYEAEQSAREHEAQSIYSAIMCYFHHKAETVYEDIIIDLVGKKAGRGAYICKKSECFLKARKARRFEKALSCQIPEEVFNQMESELKENE